MPEYSGEFEVKDLPIIGGYNRQRFKQWSPEDTANWYVASDEFSKKPVALYPCMGRKHINYLGSNRLIFSAEPRGWFKTINYAYAVVGSVVYRIESNYTPVIISGTGLRTNNGKVVFDFLVVNTIVYAVFVDDQKIYIYKEGFGTLQEVTDSHAPGNATEDFRLTKPGYVAAFGNRIAVSVANSSQFVLSAINLVGAGSTTFDPATCFTNLSTPQVFAREDGIIRQMGVLTNTLYILTDYTTGVWSNTNAVFSGTGVTFPWKKNSTYNWNYGIASSSSLAIGFGIMAFLAQNEEGLLQFMYSTGGQPQRMSNKAIDTLLQKYTNALGAKNPFTVANSFAFIYQYENTIFYRASGGSYEGYGLLDQQQDATSIEFNFESEKWSRCIELNGERNRIHRHIYFNYKHLVTLIDDHTIYDMSGQYYFNEITNPLQSNSQAADAYQAYPFRYERIVPIVYQQDYSEFETEYVEIDFQFGESDINYSSAPFLNAQFIIAEQPDGSGNPQYIVTEGSSTQEPTFVISNEGNTPTILDKTYNYLYNPSIELFFSDDGGVSFLSADSREFADMGNYVWRMRWYELGCSRNRVYKLICVSAVPIAVLGGVMSVRRVSGGAN